MKLSIFKRAFKSDIEIIRVVFVVGLVLSITTMFYTSEYMFRKTSKSLIDNFSKRDSTLEKAIMSEPNKIPAIAKLKDLYFTISHVKKSYLFMADRFNSYGYTFAMFFSFFSIVTAVLTFLILRQGWENTDSFYLKSSFLIAFFCSTLFGILPTVFSTKENTKSNLAKYNFLSGLQLDIYDLVKDNKAYIKTNTKESLENLDKEILSITKSMKENQDLYFDIFIEKVPTSIQQPLGSGSNPP